MAMPSNSKAPRHVRTKTTSHDSTYTRLITKRKTCKKIGL